MDDGGATNHDVAERFAGKSNVSSPSHQGRRCRDFSREVYAASCFRFRLIMNEIVAVNFLLCGRFLGG
jgi:hypothetical protein